MYIVSTLRIHIRMLVDNEQFNPQQQGITQTDSSWVRFRCNQSFTNRIRVSVIPAKWNIRPWWSRNPNISKTVLICVNPCQKAKSVSLRSYIMQTGKEKMPVALRLLACLGAWAALTLLVASSSGPAQAEQKTAPTVEDLRAGKGFIATRVYSAEEDQQTLKLFDGLRVADVADGMDKVGLTNIGLMSPEIHAAWKDTEHYTHRFVGIAVTARYVPTSNPPAPAMETDAFDKWVGDWYSKLSSEPFTALIRKGTALVLDDAPDSDVGSIGSNNIMGWKLAG